MTVDIIPYNVVAPNIASFWAAPLPVQPGSNRRILRSRDRRPGASWSTRALRGIDVLNRRFLRVLMPPTELTDAVEATHRNIHPEKITTGHRRG